MGLFGGLFGGGGMDPESVLNKNSSFNSPFGSVSTQGLNTTFKPKNDMRERGFRSGAISRMRNFMKSLPGKNDVNSMFDNPYYGTVRNQMYRSIDTQRTRDEKSLNDELNGMNQLGGSYAAYAKSLLNQDYGNRYASADEQARLASTDAYNQFIKNNLLSIDTLQNARSNIFRDWFYPAQVATPYQQMSNNLIQQYGQMQAQQAANQASMFGSLMGAIPSFFG